MEELKLSPGSKEKGARKASDNATEKINFDSFEFLGLMGEGSYGKVYMAKKRNTDKLYAIKVLEKKKVEKEGKQD